MTAAKVMDIVSRLPGCSGQVADAVSAHAQVKMEDASTLEKIPKSECPDIWIRLPKHKWPKSWSSMEDPSRSSRKESVRSSFGRTIMGKAIRESSIKIRLRKSSKLWMSLRSSWKGIILVCVCGRYKTGWKETTHWPNVEVLMKRRWFGRTNNIISWSCWFGLHSTRM